MCRGQLTLLTLALVAAPSLLWATTPAPQNQAKKPSAPMAAKPTTPPAPNAKIVTPTPAVPTNTAKPILKVAPKATSFSQETYDKLKSSPFKEEQAAPAGTLACPAFKKKPGFLKRVKAEGAKTSYEPTASSWTDLKQNTWYVVDQSSTTAAVLLDKKAPKKPYFFTKKATFVSSSVTQADGKPFVGCKYLVTNKKDVGRQKQMVFILYPIK
ncbi:MAG: hypothetical protein ACK5TR_05005 [Alphaproteobacteria bacterium]|jgi:hypothetical protein